MSDEAKDSGTLTVAEAYRLKHQLARALHGETPGSTHFKLGN
jgi:hypothetical protein